ncbi:Helix-turn-helix domain protein [Serratia grimesii]|jgi:DNA-binding transcriptional ArsR family regulator|uniref:ArsR/SmtB family transcription factor n=1 Tax=Serratia grimesii TaxID=82995 RepID=UPI00076F3A4F|nr:metalloregulator ArsR/SmtB family transcription factor [Serratia grimesii]CAI0941832.1 Helix-turn-helix domain [Serratia grimesii]CUW09061.1 Helix-turn-helix domain protein [Serratia grimesii]SMZ55874.1 Helix-turn-helix domain protein [Serratia grimesii]
MNNIDIEDRLAALTAAIADRTRARMLCLLMDGRAYTATELSAAVEVAASTASGHLARLLEQRLIVCIKQGRYRYFRLTGPAVAAALETLMALAGVEKPIVKSSTPTSLQFARTCYDHMAGEIAVKLHDRLHQLRWLEGDENYRLSDMGRTALTQLGVDCSAALSRRRFACSCLDWSERKAHLGGALGAALLNTFIERSWIRRQLDSRELQLTPTGKKVLKAHFDITL